MVETYFDSPVSAHKAFTSSEMLASFRDAEHYAEVSSPASIKVYEVEEVVALKREEYTGQLCKATTLADEERVVAS
jgi:hypothetical protein